MAHASTRWMGTLARQGTARAWVRRGLALAAIVASVAAAVGACGGYETLDPPEPTGTGGGGGGTTGGPCTDGDMHECHVMIGQHDGVLTCLDGVETCEGGSWGPCSGVTRTRSTPAAPPEPPERLADELYPKPLSLSGAGPCVANPCDPNCQSFQENPGPGGVTIPPMLPPFPWTVGDINALPKAVLDLGTQEPCSTAEDCQFDQYCDNPSSVGCDHHPCATGTLTMMASPPVGVSGATGLNASCSPCVEKICNADPTCCNTDYPGPCLHDVCTVGAPLKKTCDPCAAAICAPGKAPGCCEMCNVDADCTALGLPGPCDTSTGPNANRCPCLGGMGGTCPLGATCTAGICVPNWGKTNCVNKVATLCAPKTCPTPNSWKAACVGKVASICGDSCDAAQGTCSHNICYSGDPLVAACDPCVTQICTTPVGMGGDPTCCTGAGTPVWTPACVAKVKTLCGQTCPPKGQCTSWLPDEKDTTCANADLTLGVPCGGHVPVCNRGTVAVPAGKIIDIVSYPAGAGKMPSSDPDKVLSSCNPGAGGTTSCTVTLAAPLAAGKCMDVTTCVGLTDGKELMVNPAGANHINECHCENNWTVFESAACTSPACIASASVSFVHKVSMYVSVDNSASMQSTATSNSCPPGMPLGNSGNLASRWTPMTAALKTFFQDPGSAGLGVALRWWPDRTAALLCDTTPAPGCPGPGGGTCGPPHVPLGILTAASGAADPQETALVNSVNGRQPCYNTPTYPALDGAETWAINRKNANPDEEVVVVFITDGTPNGCNEDYFQIAALAKNAYYNKNIRTYVIGFGANGQTFIEQIASAGGGKAFNLTAGAGLQNALLDAMNTIRGDFLPCDISIPVDGIMDPSKVSVVYTNGSGTNTTLTKQANAAGCGLGWYSDPANPANAKLCPSTCLTIQADTGAKVAAVVPCTMSLSPTTYSQTYHADCPKGTKTQWGFFTYDSTTGSNSNVVFDIRTADTVAGLPAGTIRTAATAHTAPTDTQVCNASKSCWVDLYSKLNGLPDARRDYLELIMKLNPSADGNTAPIVKDWEITYSCPDSE
jgi:hypothetical protein